MKATKFQSAVQRALREGKSLLLVAPTGLGKTFAVTGDLQEDFRKTVYAVPLRALGSGIQQQVAELARNGKPLHAVIHHGDQQDSVLFGEEVVVTTYDQVVCGVPGLPLSLPLKAGHAVAGALLMSRLILDEAHLAWGISDHALTILLGIVDFRKKLGLQTVMLTATLPDNVAELLSSMFDSLIIVGEGNIADDEGLVLRNRNRRAVIATLPIKTRKDANGERPDYGPLDQKLFGGRRQRIYFANTVERLQQTYDRLVATGGDPTRITVLHNRMPRSWRVEAEKEVRERFGKDAPAGKWLLLTNQVAEAGLDISAPLVVSDPAPVDTLVQRAGRCARWFRSGAAKGKFLVVKPAIAQLADWCHPYREAYVAATLKTVPDRKRLTWAAERKWVNDAWGIRVDQKGKLPKNPLDKRKEELESRLTQVDFALNLFDRAAQQHTPGEIANVFREILSVEVAVEDARSAEDLGSLLAKGKRPETSSVSLGRGWQLVRSSNRIAMAVRYDEGDLRVETADYVQPGDILIVPPTQAYLHSKKGLCFDDGTAVVGAILRSNWIVRDREQHQLPREGGRRQTLVEHVRGVMRGTYARLSEDGAYTRSLVKVLGSLEPGKNPDQLAAVIAQIARVAAAFHDLGKTDRRWQERARAIDPDFGDGLIGRTARTDTRIGIPHTPPGFPATIKAAELLLGSVDSVTYLIRAIALAAARHHSSLLNPATVDHQYEPHPDALGFVLAVLAEVEAPAEVRERAQTILEAAGVRPDRQSVPLLLPNDDLFPIYALVGRAILMADREDASAQVLERWRSDEG